MNKAAVISVNQPWSGIADSRLMRYSAMIVIIDRLKTIYRVEFNLPISIHVRATVTEWCVSIGSSFKV